MESASFESFSSRASFLPSPAPSTPLAQAQSNQPIPRAWNDTWWKRLLNVVTHLLWMGGMLALGFICHTLPAFQKPTFPCVIALAVAVSGLALGFQWCLLYILEGTVFSTPWRVWIARAVLIIVPLWAIASLDYPASHQKLSTNESNITFDDLIPKPAPATGFIAPVEERIDYQEEGKTVYDILIQDDVWSPDSEDAIAVRTRGITSRSYGWWQTHVFSNGAIPVQDRAMVRASVDNAFQMAAEVKALKAKSGAK